MNRKEIKKQARERIKPSFGYIFLAIVLWTLVAFGSVAVGFIVGPIIVGGALAVSKVSYFIDIANGDDERVADINYIFKGFPKFLRALKLQVAIVLLFLGFFLAIGLVSLLLLLIASYIHYVVYIIMTIIVVLGIIFAVLAFYVFLYFPFYILADERYNSYHTKDILKLSFNLGKKHFGEIIVFDLSFILWRIGVALTAGMLNVYFSPYYQTAKATFYLERVKGLIDNIAQPIEPEVVEVKNDSGEAA